jgi:branched-chain amino acid transport system substrate-binding protein
MSFQGRLSTVAAAVAAVVVVGACSSSSKPASSNPTSAGSTSASGSAGSTAQATGVPIKVGFMCTCGGPFGATDVPIEQVYKAWVNTVNASGGLEGHPIQLITEDDEANPGTAVSNAQTLISDHVDAIADMSLVDQTWASAVQKANIPVVGVGTANNPFNTNPDFYPEAQTNDSAVYSNIATAKAEGATKLAYFYCAEAATCAESLPQWKKLGQQLGVPVVYTASIAAAQPNYTAQCVAAEQAGIKALFIGHGSPVVARVAADCNRQGYHPAYFTEGLGYASLIQNSPGINQNLWSPYENLPYWVNAPEVQTMNTALDKYYPGLRTNPNTFSEQSAGAWVSGLLLRDAVKAGGLGASDTPSSAEIIKGLESLKGDTLDGWAPPLTFAANQIHHVDCWFTGHLQNGVNMLANGGKVTCGTPTGS